MRLVQAHSQVQVDSLSIKKLQVDALAINHGISITVQHVSHIVSIGKALYRPENSVKLEKEWQDRTTITNSAAFVHTFPLTECVSMKPFDQSLLDGINLL